MKLLLTLIAFILVMTYSVQASNNLAPKEELRVIYIK